MLQGEVSYEALWCLSWSIKLVSYIEEKKSIQLLEAEACMVGVLYNIFLIDRYK